jgi:hypothetical protein
MNDELEREFTNTARMLLGVPLGGLDDYAGWLSRRVPVPRKASSAVSGKDAWIAPPLAYMGREFNRANAISLDEMEKANASPLGPGDLEGAGVEKMIRELVAPVRFHCGNFRYQSHENVAECSGAGGGRNLYRCEDVYLGVKNVAYSYFTLHTNNAFGCHGVMDSGFLIHAYNSTKVARCFEIDGCSNSSGLLFCHNCENVHDGMFCFNAKNLRNAIGNVPVGAEEYARVRKILLGWAGRELEGRKTLAMDIYNAGCAGGDGRRGR